MIGRMSTEALAENEIGEFFREKNPGLMAEVFGFLSNDTK